MVGALLKVGAGLVLLTGAAEALVYGAASLARRMEISPLVIGLTIVSVGTSLPELLVTLEAVLLDAGDVALGNVVGSNIGNMTLILGVAALARPLGVRTQVVRVDGPLLLLASLGGLLLMIDGTVGRLDGMVLVAGMGAYLATNLRRSLRAPAAVQYDITRSLPDRNPMLLDLGLLVLGLAGLMLGAHFLVKGAVSLAQMLDLGPIVVGLTIVALGTSLPELATSVVAARRGQGDIAVGNAVGSSMFNLLGILGITALVSPLSTESLQWTELATMVGVVVVALPLFRTDWTLGRLEGAFLVCCYVGYLVFLVSV